MQIVAPKIGAEINIIAVSENRSMKNRRLGQIRQPPIKSRAVASALAGMVSTVQLFIMKKLIENAQVKILKKSFKFAEPVPCRSFGAVSAKRA